MKESYIKYLKKLREFRKSLNTENNLKRGKLYFTWIKDKTEKIDKYNYERLNKQLKNIVKNNYTLKKNNYIFNNTNISKEDKEEMLYG